MQVSKETIDQAYDQIESSLDVITMAKESTNLRYLITSLIDKETRILIPTIFSLYMAEVSSENNKLIKAKEAKSSSSSFSDCLKLIRSNPSYTNSFGNELVESTNIESPRSPSDTKSQEIEKGSFLSHQLKYLLGRLSKTMIRPTDGLALSSTRSIVSSPGLVNRTDPQVSIIPTVIKKFKHAVARPENQVLNLQEAAKDNN